MLNSNLFFQGIFPSVGCMGCTVKDTPKASTLIGKSFLLRKNRLEMSLTLHILAEYKTHVYYTFWAREGLTTTGSWSTKPRSAKIYHFWQTTWPPSEKLPPQNDLMVPTSSGVTSPDLTRFQRVVAKIKVWERIFRIKKNAQQSDKKPWNSMGGSGCVFNIEAISQDICSTLEMTMIYIIVGSKVVHRSAL